MRRHGIDFDTCADDGTGWTEKEIMLKIRDYTDILPAYGYQGWLSSLFDGLGYWFGVLWSVFSLFIALVLLLIKIVVGNVVYVGGIRFFIQNRRENPSAGTIFSDFRVEIMETSH